MANFLEGDTINAYNEKMSVKGFYSYSEQWAKMEPYTMLGKDGRFHHFNSDPNGNRENYTDREKDYFLLVCSCRMVLFEKEMKIKGKMIKLIEE